MSVFQIIMAQVAIGLVVAAVVYGIVRDTHEFNRINAKYGSLSWLFFVPFAIWYPEATLKAFIICVFLTIATVSLMVVAPAFFVKSGQRLDIVKLVASGVKDNVIYMFTFGKCGKSFY